MNQTNPVSIDRLSHAADQTDPISDWLDGISDRPRTFEQSFGGDPFGSTRKRDARSWRKGILAAASLSDTGARLLLSRERAAVNLLWEVRDAHDREVARTLANAGLFEPDRSYPHVYHITTHGRFTAAVLRELGRAPERG